MATVKKTTEPEPVVQKETPEAGSAEWWDEKIPFKAYKDGRRYKDDIVVGVNGKFWRIARGEEVMLPRYVVAEINNQIEQDLKAVEYMEQEQAKATEF